MRLRSGNENGQYGIPKRERQHYVDKTQPALGPEWPCNESYVAWLQPWLLHLEFYVFARRSLEACKMQLACRMLHVARCQPSTALSGDAMRFASIEGWRGVRILALVLRGHAGVTRA
jgi:hypothetical protein